MKATAAASAAHERTVDMKSISVDDLAALGSGVPIIDVREKEEYAEAFVPGTRNVPLSRFQQSMGDTPRPDRVHHVRVRWTELAGDGGAYGGRV